MSPPFGPVSEALRGLADGLTPIELGRARDLELAGEPGELVVGLNGARGATVTVPE